MQDTQGIAGVLLLVSIVAAIFDGFYLKRGGARTPKSTVHGYWISIGVMIVVVAVLAFRSAGAAGTVAGLFLNLTFELGVDT